MEASFSLILSKITLSDIFKEKRAGLRILFVGLPDNIHTARWINQLSDQGWDNYLFPAGSGVLRPDINFKNVTIYGVSSFRPKELDRTARVKGLWPLRKGASTLSHKASRFYSGWLASMIRLLKPDIVHSLEFQHAGYLTLEAKNKSKGTFPPWIVSNWGSDIYLFGRLAEHVERIRGVLSACDYYHSECHRDVALARGFGFAGEVLPVLPGAGGLDVARIQQYRQPGLTSARRLIALKGYQHWAGRALVGLRAIELCADVLKGYRVAIYLTSPDVKIAAELVSQSTGIPIDLIPLCPHEDILKLHGQARISIGLSISDALSTSAIEAMAMGSFPIQSNTCCIEELAKDGESVLLVPPDDPQAVAAAIRHAATNDELVDRAAEINNRLIATHLDKSVIQPQVIMMYHKVAAESRLRNRI